MLLSLELTHSGAAAALADDTGKLLQSTRRTFIIGISPATQWLELIQLVRDICFREVVDVARLNVVSLAFAGPVSSEGRVLNSPLVSGWGGYDLTRGLREHLGIPQAQIITRPRVIAEALGENHYGTLQGQTDWFFVHLGRYLESAMSVEGILKENDLGAVVIERDGVLDDFGRRGTLGAYCGGLAFESRARTYSIPFVQAHELWGLAASNFAAHSLVEDFVARLAQGLSGAVALLKPRKLCISGSFGRAIWPLIQEPLALKLREVSSARAIENLEFRVPTLGDEATILGMLALALNAQGKIS